jgi:hypothetical protein
MKCPNDTPLSEWPSGWLKMEVASLYDMPEYLIMTDDEKRRAKMPHRCGDALDDCCPPSSQPC